MAEATLKDVRDFFGIPLKELKTEWDGLPESDRVQIKEGIGNGTLTY